MLDNNILIKIENLNKSYKTKSNIKKIADNLNIEIKCYEKIGLLGKNGVGKTTILNMIIGKTKIGSGKIIFNPNIITNHLNDISYLQQTFRFPGFFKVKDIKNLVLADVKKKELYDENFINRIVYILDIDGLIDKKYKKLSGGEKQKVNLFSVLAYNPKLLILDEFSNNIDMQTSLAVRQILKEIQTTIIIVSHNIYEIIDVCKKAILLENGKIKKEFLEHELTETNLRDSLLGFAYTPNMSVMPYPSMIPNMMNVPNTITTSDGTISSPISNPPNIQNENITSQAASNKSDESNEQKQTQTSNSPEITNSADVENL